MRSIITESAPPIGKRLGTWKVCEVFPVSISIVAPSCPETVYAIFWCPSHVSGLVRLRTMLLETARACWLMCVTMEVVVMEVIPCVIVTVPLWMPYEVYGTPIEPICVVTEVVAVTIPPIAMGTVMAFEGETTILVTLSAERLALDSPFATALKVNASSTIVWLPDRTNVKSRGTVFKEGVEMFSGTRICWFAEAGTGIGLSASGKGRGATINPANRQKMNIISIAAFHLNPLSGRVLSPFSNSLQPCFRLKCSSPLTISRYMAVFLTDHPNPLYIVSFCLKHSLLSMWYDEATSFSLSEETKDTTHRGLDRNRRSLKLLHLPSASESFRIRRLCHRRSDFSLGV